MNLLSLLSLLWNTIITKTNVYLKKNQNPSKLHKKMPNKRRTQHNIYLIYMWNVKWIELVEKIVYQHAFPRTLLNKRNVSWVPFTYPKAKTKQRRVGSSWNFPGDFISRVFILFFMKKKACKLIMIFHGRSLLKLISKRVPKIIRFAFGWGR